MTKLDFKSSSEAEENSYIVHGATDEEMVHILKTLGYNEPKDFRITGPSGDDKHYNLFLLKSGMSQDGRVINSLKSWSAVRMSDNPS